MTYEELYRLWFRGRRRDWERAYNDYWYSRRVTVNLFGERRLQRLDVRVIRRMSGDQLYRFFRKKYVKWKFRDRWARRSFKRGLRRFVRLSSTDTLKMILNNVFQIDPADIQLHLLNLSRIDGLGVTGASALLAALRPDLFGAIDRSAADALMYLYGGKLKRNAAINSSELTAGSAAMLIGFMRNKSAELNARFHTAKWTPRKIGMILSTARPR